jgi:hypothetical protein
MVVDIPENTGDMMASIPSAANNTPMAMLFFDSRRAILSSSLLTILIFSISFCFRIDF